MKYNLKTENGIIETVKYLMDEYEYKDDEQWMQEIEIVSKYLNAPYKDIYVLNDINGVKNEKDFYEFVNKYLTPVKIHHTRQEYGYFQFCVNNDGYSFVMESNEGGSLDYYVPKVMYNEYINRKGE